MDTSNQDAWAIIQGLDGMNSKLLDHPGVLHVPSIMEERELPEAITHDGGGKVLVATDSRLIEIETSMLRKSVRKVTSYRYQGISSFEVQRGVMAIGFNMITTEGTQTLAAQKDGREAFASTVNACLQAAPPAPGGGAEESLGSPPAPVPAADLPPGALWFAKGVNGQVTLLEHRIKIERKGVLAFATYGLRGTKEILISEMTSIEYKDAGGVLSGYILFLYRGGRDVRSSVFSEDSITNNENAIVFIKESQPAFDTLRSMLNDKLEEYRKPQQVVVQQEPSRLDELKKLGELRDSGIITGEEFESEKARLLGA